MSLQNFFRLFSPKMLFFSKKLFHEKIFKFHIPPPKKKFIFVTRHTLRFKRDLASRNGFLSFSPKIQLFLKNPPSNKIFRIKSYFNFWGKTPPFPKKLSNVPRKHFFVVFSENTAFFKKIVE